MFEKPRILVVDDELSCREMYRGALELHGYEVVVAATAQEAIAALSQGEIAAIVCDIQLPGNGVSVYEHLLRHHPELRGRFIFVTGSTEKKAAVEQTHRATPCLLKPFPLNLLVDAMRSTLGS